MSRNDRNVEIRMDRIPVRGGIGAVLVIITLLGAMLLELEGLRLPAIAGLIGGLLVGGVLIVWRRLSQPR
jgi:hypothetical protein